VPDHDWSSGAQLAAGCVLDGGLVSAAQFRVFTAARSQALIARQVDAGT
jgi:hypothetical protein